MELEVAIAGMQDAQKNLRSEAGVNNPSYMSEQMTRLSAYTGAAEERLAEYERDYEIEYAKRLHQYMVALQLKVTQAERRVDIETAELKSQIKYLTRMVASAWKQTGITQSRFNHLTTLASTQV